MTYGSLKFDNEVINALYKPDEKKYWDYYLQTFYDEWYELDEAAKQNTVSKQKHLLNRNKIFNSLVLLAKDLYKAHPNDPIIKWIDDTLKDIEIIKMVSTNE